MDNCLIRARLKALRESMAEESIDYYLIPTADFHNSEYVNDYFKVREYFSAFTGSNGTLLVWQEGAGLWTDGRYFLQAEKELEGTGITLFKMDMEGVPTIREFLQEHMQMNQTLGFDGRVVSALGGIGYEKALAFKQIRFRYDMDLAEGIWEDRPPFPAEPVYVLEESVAGERYVSKRQKLIDAMEEQGAEAIFLTKLDDIMWLFNLRGNDVECNPVAMSYAYITASKSVLFLMPDALSKDVSKYLSNLGVEVEDYDKVVFFLKQVCCGQNIQVDLRNINYSTYRVLADGSRMIDAKNPTEDWKAIKNPVELAHMDAVFLKDSVAVTKFIYWLKTNVGKEQLSEISASDYLERLRRQIPEFIDLSFPTIAGYGANGAIIHYEATEESNALLKPEGFLLVDSGGQYMGGTTDVTRTISLGPLTDEMKKHYTLVAAGMLQLMNATWKYGCTGRNLDICAREPLWSHGLDYNHGTGHGIGYILNVHEGPQNIRWKYAEGAKEAVLEAGMVVSDEPGVYIAGSHGVRIENCLVVENTLKNEYGQFMRFKNLTWVPLDRDALDVRYLTENQKELVDMYQKKVDQLLTPYLTEEEAQWLHRETSKI